MICTELKTKYGIKGVYHGVWLDFDYLFSGYILDPEFIAEENARLSGMKYFDIIYTFGTNNRLATQVIEFKNKEGYDRYLQDKVLIFDV